MQPHAILEIAVYPVAQHKIQHVKRLVVSNAALTNSKRNLAFVVGRQNCECNREGFTRHVKAPFPKLLDDRKNKLNVQWKRPGEFGRCACGAVSISNPLENSV